MFSAGTKVLKISSFSLFLPAYIVIECSFTGYGWALPIDNECICTFRKKLKHNAF
jgi:hypothetical protein